TLWMLVGCASPLHPGGASARPDDAHWAGRLALNLETQPAQSFSADFALEGDAAAGSLSLTSALGTTLARLQWDAHGAVLHARGESRRFDSLQELTHEVAGTALPLDGLFAWLRGTPTQVAGWQADLGELAQGRLSAQRLAPEPVARLRIILER
ncbi:MAG: lipoprotein insertase outer membrane protein LolB, partial [Rhodoferax sp.]